VRRNTIAAAVNSMSQWYWFSLSGLFTGVCRDTAAMATKVKVNDGLGVAGCNE
jgi:hypothetical protein